ncbi:MAG: hypothetical protein ACTHNM_08380 [Dyella sp.]|uniref:S9 family peptidase n=1 Tax=Dyella sp. TaxID=1869338 RepID=UPI003F7F854E
MTRIQDESAANGTMAAISPDGRMAAFVTWHGDLRRNTNVYDLRLIRLVAPWGVRIARVLLSRDYHGDRIDPDASPIRQLSFVRDGRSLAYLGLDDKGVAQVYTVEISTGVEHQLTHHPTSVRSFVVGSQGRLLAFSAVAFPKDEVGRRLKEDGVFLWDRSLFPDYQSSFPAGAVLARLTGWNGIRQYFLAGPHPRLIFDSRQSRPARQDNDAKADVSPTQSLADDSSLVYASLSADPSGKHLLMYPYRITTHPLHPERYAYYRKAPMNAYGRRVAAQVAEIDVDTGRITPLVDAPSPQFVAHESGSPLWSPDGRSVVLYTLFPDRPEQSPAWVEMSLSMRRLLPLGLPKGWRPVGWSAEAGLVLEGKEGRFAVMRRGLNGDWKKPEEVGSATRFYPDWRVATDGNVILGVDEGLRHPPELAALVPGAAGSVRLTDLNPQLHGLSLGAVAPYRWRQKNGYLPDGFLIKPVDYRPGKRYPLVLLLDDAVLRPRSPPYLLDATVQLSGAAIQMLAGQGFMVLYYHDPPVGDVVETPEEPLRVRRDVERVIAKLDGEGLIDPTKVGISGWSRAGFYTMYLLVHSRIRFAAASNIDGGTTEYTDRLRPFTDAELSGIKTPLLFEPHGLWSLVDNSQVAARMHALDEPIEILYFDSAPHSTVRPQHRWRSLHTEIDWWNFWLRGRIDPDPEKARQYKHWKQLKVLQSARDGRS